MISNPFGYDFNFTLKGIHTIDAIKEKRLAEEVYANRHLRGD
jgi:hypothetical protein